MRKRILVRRCFFLFAFSLFCLTFSCTQDSYEKGEGEYSLMRGDFAEAHINSDKLITSITTDDGELLALKENKKAKWITTADTTYRCMLYYNKVKDASGKLQADVLSIGQVPCPGIHPLSEFDKELRTDPVKFESLWMSRTGKYLNMSLLLMTGSTDDTTAVQQLALVSDTLLRHPDNTMIRPTCLSTIPPRPMSAFLLTAFWQIPSVSPLIPTTVLSSRPCPSVDSITPYYIYIWGGGNVYSVFFTFNAKMA